MNDTELLRAWAAHCDEAAFAELVRRHLDLVHASARRQVGASPLADDVAQAVFLVLARKAGSLGSRVVLSGWLFRTTRFVAARALRPSDQTTRWCLRINVKSYWLFVIGYPLWVIDDVRPITHN